MSIPEQPQTTPGEETWAPVRDWEGVYEVSDQGRVRSVDRVKEDYQGHSYRITGKVRRSPVGTGGYRVVSMADGTRRTVRAVHLLVLDAFRGPAVDGEIAVFANGDKTDCRLENLEWGARKKGRKHVDNAGLCPRGHKLIAPNLAEWARKSGKDVCLSCSRARSYAHYKPELKDEIDRLADEYYAEIMKDEEKK